MKRAVLLFTLLAAGCDGCSRASTDASQPDAYVRTAASSPDAAPVSAAPIPAASVAAAVNPKHLPAYTGPTGSVEGTIFVTGDAAPVTPADFHLCPDGEKTYGHAFREGSEKPPAARWLADAVVAVTGYGSGTFLPEAQEAKAVTIDNCAFSTRTVTVTYGQRVEVKNLTRDFWTPKLEPVQASVIMMATPGGDPVKLYPKTAPAHYHLVDHDRKYAVDDLYTFLHPLHTSSAIGGKYRIDGVPVGKVTVNTSHPRIPGGQASKEVEIKEGVVSRVDLTLDFKAPVRGESDAGPAPRLH